MERTAATALAMGDGDAQLSVFTLAKGRGAAMLWELVSDWYDSMQPKMAA